MKLSVIISFVLSLLWLPAAHAERLPGAVEFESFRDYSLTYAWLMFKWDRDVQTAGVLLNKWEGDGKGYKKVLKNTQHYSHIYHLLLAQMRRGFDAEWCEKNLSDNRSLIDFIAGTNGMFNHHPEKGRKYLAAGIFSAAQLTSVEIKKAKNAGMVLPVLDTGKSDQENNMALAEAFIEMEPKDKAIILNELVLPKFKHVSVDKNNWPAPQSLEGRQENLFWNLGFYLISEVLLGNSGPEYKKLTEDMSGLYRVLDEKFRFDTVHKDLL